jgi:Predicted acetyltransferase
MDGFKLIEGVDQMQIDCVMALLKTTHWAATRPKWQERLALEHSVCFGAVSTETGEQIAMARAVTDYGTTYCLCDVIVAPDWQGRGVGKAMLERIQAHPALKDLRGILISRDAQLFYEKFAFEKSDRAMVKKEKQFF